MGLMADRKIGLSREGKKPARKRALEMLMDRFRGGKEAKDSKSIGWRGKRKRRRPTWQQYKDSFKGIQV